ncbi:virB8 family protein (plasmid) [Methylobacterium radiotolerans]|jgi:type IV secretion system protein VirB8
MSESSPSAASALPGRVDRRYFEEAATWEHSVARAERRSRSLAWVIATIMTAVALTALGTLALVLPLKTYEPYMVEVDRSTGFVEVKRPTAVGPLSQDEAVTMFNVVRYIRARETYDPKALKENYDLAQLLATGDAARELTEIYSPVNPANPIKLNGTGTTTTVTIRSVTFPNRRTALVRFATDDKSGTGILHHDWVALVRFQYASTPMRNEYRFENPLGFQVVEYRRDQETAPSPGSTPTGAGGRS